MALVKGDKSAAIIGAVVSTIILVAFAWTVSALTSASFEGHGAAAPAAGAPAAH